MSDAREELARLLVSKMIDFSLIIPDYEQLADLMARGVLASGYAKPSPAAEAGLREALELVLERDAEWGLSGMSNDCGCMRLSARAERQYEKGCCPHQIARGMLTVSAAHSTRPAGESAGVAEAWRAPTDVDWSGEYFLGFWRGGGTPDVVRWNEGEWEDERGAVFGVPDWIASLPPAPALAARASQLSPVDGGEG